MSGGHVIVCDRTSLETCRATVNGHRVTCFSPFILILSWRLALWLSSSNSLLYQLWWLPFQTLYIRVNLIRLTFKHVFLDNSTIKMSSSFICTLPSLWTLSQIIGTRIWTLIFLKACSMFRQLNLNLIFLISSCESGVKQ